MSERPTLEFWYEFGSTYTYLSVMRIEALAAEQGVDVAWRPFLMMPILNALGVDNPFVNNPPRAAYMWRDLERRAAALGIDYRKPSVYPPNSLLPARVARLAQEEGWVADFTRAVMRLHWTKDVTIGSEDNIRQALGETGQDADDVLARALADDNKMALRQQTEEAQAHGLFGSPSFLVGDELFWGDDRLEAALDWCAHRVVPD